MFDRKLIPFKKNDIEYSRNDKVKIIFNDDETTTSIVKYTISAIQTPWDAPNKKPFNWDPILLKV